MKKIVLGVLFLTGYAAAMGENFSEQLNEYERTIEDNYNKDFNKVSQACNDMAALLIELSDRFRHEEIPKETREIYWRLSTPYLELARLAKSAALRPRTLAEFKAKLQEFAQPQPQPEQRSWFRRISFSNKKP